MRLKITVDDLYYFVAALFLSIVIGIVLFVLFFWILCSLFPPVTSDGLHATMPIGQVFLSILLAGIAGLCCLVLLFRKFRNKRS